MSESQTDTNKEELRAFEKKMHDEGAAAFADGPSPWETWDDKSDPRANNRVWEGSSKRIYPNKHPQQTLGDRVLSGLAMLSLATMVVGIAGVYFSDPQPRQIAATGTGVQPLTINRAPPVADKVIAHLKELPAPAAGTTTAAGHASASNRDDAALSAPVVVASAAPASDSAVQTPVLPEVTVAGLATDDTNSRGGPATQSAPASNPLAATTDTANTTTPPGPDTATVDLAPQPIAANDIGTAPIATVMPPAAAPVSATTAATANDDVMAAASEHQAIAAIPEAASDTAATITAQPPQSAPLADTRETPEADIKTETSLAPAVTTPAEPTASEAVTTAQTGADAADTDSDLETLPTPLAAAAMAPVADIKTGTSLAPVVTAPVEITASDAVTTAQAGTDVTDTVAGLEALPVPMAESAVTIEETPANSTAMSPVTATNTVVAIADPGDGSTTMAPAEAAKATVATTKTGDWVVNLASYTRKSTAGRMLAGFRAKGVDAELVTVMINDKPMHRVRVAGFASSRAAKASINQLEQQLDLEGIWISRK